MKVAKNVCYGGFSISDEAVFMLCELTGNKELSNHSYSDDESRTDENLISVIEFLGEKANGKFAEIEIVEVPDDVDWCITESDGIETIREVHRTW